MLLAPSGMSVAGGLEVEANSTEAQAEELLMQHGFAPVVDPLDSEDGVEAEITSSDSGSFEVTLTKSGASGFAVICTGITGANAVREPHYSTGAGGAIYKTVIKCTGVGLSSVKLRVQGLLTYGPASSRQVVDTKFVQRAKTSEYRNVAVNGKAETFYTPKKGSNGGRGTGWWRATSTWYFIVDGKYSTLGSQMVTTWRRI